MKNVIKPLLIFSVTVIGIILFSLVFHSVASKNRKEQAEANMRDGKALQSVITEAYITTHRDPNFVNTATKDKPMEVPEKYYTYVESVQGHGPVYVFIDVDGNIDAYFGSPEKGMDYYLALTGN